MLPKINPTSTKSWSLLNEDKFRLEKITINNLFSNAKTRFQDFSIAIEGLLFDYSKNRLDEKLLNNLIKLAEECKLKQAIDSFFKGEIINETENRSVLHPLLRHQSKDEFPLIDEEKFKLIENFKLKVKSFTNLVLDHSYLGFSGKPIQDVVNIGIGGSDLGPKFVSNALKNYKTKLNVHYVSNLDPNAITDILSKINPETTLFIIASKTFTTEETINNANLVKQYFKERYKDDEAVKNHLIAVTSSKNIAIEYGIKEENIFELWDWVGGRFSLWSSIGLSISLAIGFDNFEKLLKGANTIDNHFKNEPFEKNIPFIMALLGIWYNNFLDFNTHAIHAYNSNLIFLVPFLQQVEMESNGKHIDRLGNRVTYKTCPIIWGDVGTDAQHAFFQLLHQGTIIVPTDFIAIKETDNLNKSNHKKLLSNFLAQTQTLAFGKLNNTSTNPHKEFDGNRPSNSIILDELTPENLGKLIAIYEHKVFVQGIIWNIFSFDQWGVEQGKNIAKSIYKDLKEDKCSNYDLSTNNLMSYLLK